MIILAIIAVGLTFYVFWTVVAGLFVVEVGKEIKKDVDKNLSSTTNSKLDAKLKKKGLEPFIPQTKNEQRRFNEYTISWGSKVAATRKMHAYRKKHGIK